MVLGAATHSFALRGASAFALAAALALATGCAASPGEDEEVDDAEGETSEAEGALTLRGFVEPTEAHIATARERFGHVDPRHVVPVKLLEKALGFVVANTQRIEREDYVAVIDYAKHSREDRFFVVSLETGAVTSHVVAHGSGSDPANSGYAKYFGNGSGSNRSSLGYFVTGETYSGRAGFSLKLDGLSDTNSAARSRGIVIHGAAYVSDGRSLQGRSWGCPAVPMRERDGIIQRLRNGRVVFSGRSDAP